MTLDGEITEISSGRTQPNRVQITDASQATSEALRVQLSRALQTVIHRQELGFWQVPERSELWESAKASAEQLRSTHTRLAVIGIGGSSLGGKTLCQSLLDTADLQNVVFIDHLDVATLSSLVRSKFIGPDTAWAIISKSGRTVETLAVVEWLERFSGQTFFKQNNTVVITEPVANPLNQWAANRTLSTLKIPLDVGGRFSVFTPAGTLPYLFFNSRMAEELRQGTQRALAHPQPWVELGGQFIESFARSEWVSVFWTYSQRLESLGFWFQQLWSESLGKSRTRSGALSPRVSTLLPLVGPRDQHSVLQQLSDGFNDKYIVFVRESFATTQPKLTKESIPLTAAEFGSAIDFMAGRSLQDLLRAECLATQTALRQRQVQSSTMVLSEITPVVVGEVLMGLQLMVAALGEYLDINAFDQPGVELGKQLTQRLLAE